MHLFVHIILYTTMCTYAVVKRKLFYLFLITYPKRFGSFFSSKIETLILNGRRCSKKKPSLIEESEQW